MNAHQIGTESRFFRDRGPFADGEWKYRATCSCGVDFPWGTAGAATWYESRHRFEVAA